MQEKPMPEKAGTTVGTTGTTAGTPTAEKKKKTWKSRLLTFLMYGWMLVLIFIFGMIILISTLVNRGC